jgi:long-chain acyl-CoA synthetase
MAERFESLVDLWEKSCTKYAARQLFGTKTAGGWTWITYAQFRDEVDACRAALARLGVGPGDRVGIVADNRVEWAVACYATYGRGAAFVPMYEAQKSDEWAFILEDSACKVVFGAKPAIHEKLVAVQRSLPRLSRVIGLDLPADHPDGFRGLLAQAAGTPVRPERPTPGDVAGLIYTSGTTGKPKGVILSHGNICSNINAIHQIFTFTADDRSLSFLPWAHSFGQTCELHGLVSMGCSIAINDEIPSLLPNLAAVKPTILFAVPRIFNRIYDGVNKQIAERPGIIQNLFHRGIAAATRQRRGEPVGLVDRVVLALADRLIFSTIRARFGGRLKYAISGSAALNPDVANFIDALGIEVYEGYGLTETSPIATANFPGARKIGSVGKPIPGVRITIDRAVTGDEQHGEVVIYGPNVMQGYHNRPDENAAVLMPDGGFRSGDMGYVSSEGYLYITGRLKEQYKLENGKYVVPSPLEEDLKLSPYIANVMVHGANKPYNVALVVPDAEAVEQWRREHGGNASDDEIRTLIAEEIRKHSGAFKSYERPEKFVLVREDFTTDNGMLTPTLKLKRRAVLARYEKQLDELYRGGR